MDYQLESMIHPPVLRPMDESEPCQTDMDSVSVSTSEEFDFSPYDNSHLGTAEAFIDYYKGAVRCSPSLGWLIRDGRVYVHDPDGIKALTLVAKFMRMRAAYALEHGMKPKEVSTLFGCNLKPVDAVMSFIRRSERTYVPDAHLERGYVSTPDGVLDIRTGKIVDGDFIMTSTSKVSYDPNADMTAWQVWAEHELGKEQAEYLQMMLGYGLTGECTEQVVLYLYGPPRAGKGVITSSLIELFGKSVVVSSDANPFLRGFGDYQHFVRAGWEVGRFMAISEVPSSGKFDESVIKSISGGDQVAACYKGKRSYTFKSQALMIFSSNFPPKGDTDDHAFWSRFRVVEFKHSYVGREDSRFYETMQSDENLKGLFRWLVEGAQRYYALRSDPTRRGPIFGELSESLDVKTEIRRELSGVAQFFEESLVVDANATTASEDIYAAYSIWCMANNTLTLKSAEFSKRLIGFVDRPDVYAEKQPRWSPEKKKVARFTKGIRFISEKDFLK